MILHDLFVGLFAWTVLPAAAIAAEVPSGDPAHLSAIPLISPPYEVINVAVPGFGDRIGGGDYGLANVEPLEVGRNVGRDPAIRVVRTPREFRLSRRGEARFQVQIGEVQAIYFWVESPPVQGAWHLSVAISHPDGYRQSIFSEDLLRESVYFAHVPPRALLEFRVTSKERTLRLSKRFIFTVSPVHISLLSGFRQVPYTIERHVSP